MPSIYYGVGRFGQFWLNSQDAVQWLVHETMLSIVISDNRHLLPRVTAVDFSDCRFRIFQRAALSYVGERVVWNDDDKVFEFLERVGPKARLHAWVEIPPEWRPVVQRGFDPPAGYFPANQAEFLDELFDAFKTMIPRWVRMVS